MDIWAVDDEQAGRHDTRYIIHVLIRCNMYSALPDWLSRLPLLGTMHSWWIAKGPDDMCGRVFALGISMKRL